MTTPQTILRESIAVLPVLVIGAAWLDGVSGAAPVLLAGVLAVLNFAALAWALSHLVGEGPATDPTGVVIVKTTGTLLAWVGLMVLFNPIWVLVGANTVILGIVIRGTLEALFSAQPVLAEGT